MHHEPEPAQARALLFTYTLKPVAGRLVFVLPDERRLEGVHRP